METCCLCLHSAETKGRLHIPSLLILLVINVTRMVEKEVHSHDQQTGVTEFRGDNYSPCRGVLPKGTRDTLQGGQLALADSPQEPSPLRHNAFVTTWTSDVVAPLLHAQNDHGSPSHSTRTAESTESQPRDRWPALKPPGASLVGTGRGMRMKPSL